MKYDVVVVGAGSAGCPLAARVSEDPNLSVLLLEAGPDYPDLETLPDDLKYGHTRDAELLGAPHNWALTGTINQPQGGDAVRKAGRYISRDAGSRMAVFGHSWGAGVARNVAARFPDRVAALGLIDGGFSRSAGTTSSWEEARARVTPRDVSGTREEFLDRLRTQLSFCWNEQVERIVQTMVYEDQDGQMQDILRPENHIQVMRAMWEEPASDTYPKISCPTVIIPAGPTPERAFNERSLLKQERVEAAGKGIANSRIRWIPETVHDIGYHKPEELATVIKEFLAETTF